MNEIPPKTEWKNLSIHQLYDVKTQLMNLYYGMNGVRASFAGQYKKFISDVEVLIRAKEAEIENHE